MKIFILYAFTALLLCFSCDPFKHEAKPKAAEKQIISPKTTHGNRLKSKPKATADSRRQRFIPRVIPVIKPKPKLPSKQNFENKIPEHMHGMLATHNDYRDAVSVPHLRWSNKLAATAMDWAQRLKDRTPEGEPFVFEHHSHSDYPGTGENLSKYWQWSRGSTYAWDLKSLASPSEVAKAWGEEKHDYDYASNTCRLNEKCGHYTQMVWKDTKEVGCAKVSRKDYDKNGDYQQQELWVCHYKPAGNYKGQRPY